MLAELAFGPETLRADEYATSALADVCLAQFRTPLFEDFVVRDLRAGGWQAYVLAQGERLHPKGKELLKKLKSQSRLVPHVPVLPSAPLTDEEWEFEVIGSHHQSPVAGMVFGQQAKTLRYAGNPLVACPQQLANATFWSSRATSRRVPRATVEYCRLLELVHRHANWIAFIDPHLDPSAARYRDFHQVPAQCAGRTPMPVLELHRVAWLGDGRDKRPRSAEIEELFRRHLEPKLRQVGVQAKVFLWDDFHDRFFVSNLIGLNWSNGFDTTRDARSSVTITRLSRGDRDDVQKEFSVNSPSHDLKHEFSIR